MAEIADPMTIGLLTLTAVGGAAVAKNMGGDVRPPAPVGKVEQVEGSIEAQAEKEQKRRLKQAAAVMLKDWEPPVLGTPGMLGVSA